MLVAPDWIKDICIKFYGIMHWTLALYNSLYYRTSRDHDLYSSTSCSHSLNRSNKFSTKLSSGCLATETPQKLCGQRRPTPYDVLHTLNRVTATET